MPETQAHHSLTPDIREIAEEYARQNELDLTQMLTDLESSHKFDSVTAGVLYCCSMDGSWHDSSWGDVDTYGTHITWFLTDEHNRTGWLLFVDNQGFVDAATATEADAQLSVKKYLDFSMCSDCDNAWEDCECDPPKEPF